MFSFLQNYYFSLNSDETRALVEGTAAPPPIKQNALFSVGRNPPPPETHLVLRVEKAN